MWKTKHRTLTYLGIGFTSTVSAFIGVRHWVQAKELSAEEGISINKPNEV